MKYHEIFVIVSLLVTSILALSLYAIISLLNLYKRKQKKIYEKSGLSSTLGFLICLFISVWCMRYAVGYYCISTENDVIGNDGLTVFEEIFNSGVHALQSFSMDEDYTAYLEIGKEMVEKVISESKWAQTAYGSYASLQNVIAPIAGGAFILDILASLFPNLRLLLLCHIFFWKKKVYFSELNEKSLALAKDILKTSEDDAVIIFSDVYVDGEADEKKSEMLAEAKKLGMICVRDDLAHIRKPSHGDREYILMDEFESDNLQKLIDLTADENVKYVKNSKIYFFVQTDLYVQIERQIRDRFNGSEKKKLLGDGKMPTLIPIDEYRNLVQNLFDEVPLYEPLIDKNEKSKMTLTIFGNGVIGTQAFLTAYWLGQMMSINSEDNGMTPCELTINVVSKDSPEAFWSKIDYINPEIRATAVSFAPILCWNDDGEKNAPYCTINYKQADVKNGNILSLDKNEGFLESDYFVVALGSDSDNVAIAEKLHRLIGEKRINSRAQGKAVIAYAVFDSKLAIALNRQKKYYITEEGKEAAYLYMYAFGSIDRVYCCENVYRSKYSLRSKQIGNAYANAQKVSSRDNEIRNNEKENYQYWANLARSEHISYKLFSLGWITTSVFERDDEKHKEDVEKQYEIYQKLAILHNSKLINKEDEENGYLDLSSDEEKECYIEDRKKKLLQKFGLEKKYQELEEKKEYLAWLEHRRWCAFVRTMGYRSVDIDRVMNTVRDNKNFCLKLHACLVEAFQPKSKSDKYLSGTSKDYLDQVFFKVKRYNKNAQMYKKYDYYSFEFDYEFVNVLKNELEKVQGLCLDKYFNDKVYSHKIIFDENNIAIPVDDIKNALKNDYDIVDAGIFEFRGVKFIKR